MDGRRLSVVIGGPGVLVFVTILIAVVSRFAWWALVLVLVAVLTSPLWPLAGLRGARSESSRIALATSLNVHLTGIVAVAVSALLMLVFIGLFLMVIVIVAQAAWSVDSARRVRKGEPLVRPRLLIDFKSAT